MFFSKPSLISFKLFEKDDAKVLQTLKLVKDLKESQPFFAELLKAVEKYTAQMEKVHSAGDAMIEAAREISKHEGCKVSKGLETILDAQSEVSKSLKEISDGLEKNIEDDYRGRISEDKHDADNFEKEWKSKRAGSLKNLRKSESTSEKLNKPKAKKKNPEKAEEAQKELKTSEDTHEKLLTDELLDIALTHRKKFVHLVKQCDRMLESNASAFETALEKLKQAQEQTVDLTTADAPEDLPQNVQQLVGTELCAKRERKGSSPKRDRKRTGSSTEPKKEEADPVNGKDGSESSSEEEKSGDDSEDTESNPGTPEPPRNREQDEKAKKSIDSLLADIKQDKKPLQKTGTRSLLVAPPPIAAPDEPQKEEQEDEHEKGDEVDKSYMDETSKMLDFLDSISGGKT